MSVDAMVSSEPMSAELAELVERLVAQVKAGPPADIEELVGGHPEHAEALRRILPAVLLLADLSQTTDEGPSVGVGGDPLGELGDYRIVREVGRGGMGIVYEAEQISLGRRVALKVLPFAATMDPKHLQRFKNEAKAAASLRHDHIVHVYGVGCERGVHYYAMEFIEGQTLAAVIEELRGGHSSRSGAPHTPPGATGASGAFGASGTIGYQSVENTLGRPAPPTAPIAALSTERSGPKGREFYRTAARLIADAADALEHAHQLGIVHRDVKPANLLLDAAGKLYVSDFGLARVGPDAGLTVSGDLLGTLRYMAPEQALSRHGLVDYRADVYGLGCTLYELLTGRPAFDAAERAEILRQIAYDDPAPPRTLERTIPAELETIALKCLAKNPNDRYVAAGELADDLRRWLNHPTIRARRPSLWQRADKWVRRHSTAVLAAAVALLMGTGVSTWQAVKARDAERRATTETAIAQAVNDFLLGDLLGQANIVSQFRYEFEGNLDLTVKEALDRAAAKIGKRFQDQPLVEAAIQTVIGKGYGSLLRHQIGLAHLQRAVMLRQAHLGPDHPDTLDSMGHLAAGYLSVARYSDAIVLFEQIVDYKRTRFGPNHPETLVHTDSLARAYHTAGLWDKSVPLMEQVYEKQRSICGPTHVETVDTMHVLAWSYLDVGRITESIVLHEKAVEWLKSKNDAVRQPRIWWIIGFAIVCQQTGKLDQADQLLHEALEQNKKCEDSVGRRLQRAHILARISLNLLLREQYDEAEPLIRQAVASTEKLGAESFRSFFFMTLHGAVLSGQQRYAEAEPLLLKGYEGMTQWKAIVPGNDERRVLADAGGWVVRFYEATNQPEKAEEWRVKLPPKGPH